MNVVLYQPEIPPNTGNIARLCAATKSELHLIEPLGFELSDKTLKRAGMDYWKQVHWKTWPDWKSFWESQVLPFQGSAWFVETGGPTVYSDAKFQWSDWLVFGSETRGLPKDLLIENQANWLNIPMLNSESRSLNLSNCVALTLYEGLRQVGFAAE